MHVIVIGIAILLCLSVVGSVGCALLWSFPPTGSSCTAPRNGREECAWLQAPVCDASNDKWVECVSDEQCGRGTCRGNVCVEHLCAMDEDCPGAWTCDPSTALCTGEEHTTSMITFPHENGLIDEHRPCRPDSARCATGLICTAWERQATVGTCTPHRMAHGTFVPQRGIPRFSAWSSNWHVQDTGALHYVLSSSPNEGWPIVFEWSVDEGQSGHLYVRWANSHERRLAIRSAVYWHIVDTEKDMQGLTLLHEYMGQNLGSDDAVVLAHKSKAGRVAVLRVFDPLRTLFVAMSKSRFVRTVEELRPGKRGCSHVLWFA